MTGPRLRARWIGDDDAGSYFGAEHVDPRGCAWTVCECQATHRTEAEAVACARLTLDASALPLRATFAAATGDARAWGDLDAAELDGWRMVALSALRGTYLVT